MFQETAATKRMSELFDMYVPMNGPAKTAGGEIVRAINRLGYRWFNDGDMLGVGYGNETCNFAGRFLAVKCTREIAQAVSGIWGCASDEVYDAGLSVLEEMVVKYLDENPWLFEMDNDDDYLNYKEYEDTHYEDDDEEEWDDYEEEDWEEEEECE